jgi:uncharacterized protein
MLAFTPVQMGLVAGSVFVGATTQRLTGLGFALVAAPLLVLVCGPIQGVLISNVMTLAINLVVGVSTWRDIEWRRVAFLAIPALIAVTFGARIAKIIPGPAFMVVIGSLVLFALVLLIVLRGIVLFPGRGGTVVAGALSGFMNVTAGVGGPAITLYAVGASWPQQSFVASMQLYFGVLNTGSIIAKGLPMLPLAMIPVLATAILLGVLVGNRLVRIVSDVRARQAVLVLAIAGSAGTIIKGALAL